ncbi:hypothetical protein BsWGS_05582 [Bradybaena similaris]
MQRLTCLFVGRTSLSQCVQHYLHHLLFSTIPTLERSNETQKEQCNKDPNEIPINDDKDNGTAAKENDGVRGTAKKSTNPEEKVKLLAKLLQCSIDDMQTLVSKHSFFTHLSPELIKVKIDIMLLYGLPISLISAYPRPLYQASASELDRRLQLLKDNSLLSKNSVVTSENIWNYLECSVHHFDHTLIRLCAERNALEGCYDRAEYLQFRLSITQQQALNLLNSPPLGTDYISNVKLKTILDFFLIETNLGAEFYIRHRKLSMYSILRLRTRWNVIVSEGITSESKMLNIWTMSEKMFKNNYNNNIV